MDHGGGSWSRGGNGERTKHAARRLATLRPVVDHGRQP